VRPPRAPEDSLAAAAAAAVRSRPAVADRWARRIELDGPGYPASFGPLAGQANFIPAT
jgi:hypothetical protein